MNEETDKHFHVSPHPVVYMREQEEKVEARCPLGVSFRVTRQFNQVETSSHLHKTNARQIRAVRFVNVTLAKSC